MKTFELSPEDIKAWWDALPDEDKTSSGQVASLECADRGISVGINGSDDPWAFFKKGDQGMWELLDHLQRQLGLFEAQKFRLALLGTVVERLKLKYRGVEPPRLHGDDFVDELPEDVGVQEDDALAVTDEQIEAVARQAEEFRRRERADTEYWEAERDRIAASKRQESTWPKWLGVAASVVCVGLATRLVRDRY